MGEGGSSIKFGFDVFKRVGGDFGFDVFKS